MFFCLDLFSSTFLRGFFVGGFCGFFFSAWGIITFLSAFPAELIYNLISLFFKSGVATTVWRTNGSWACSLTSPAAPCTSPSPPVSSRFPWDVASVTANAKSTCFLVAVRSLRTRRGEGGGIHQCDLVLFFLEGLHSVQGPLLRMGEGERGVHAAGPWLQVSKGSGWTGHEALAVAPGSLGQSYLKRGALRERKMWEGFVSTLFAFTSEMSHKFF